MRPRSLSALLVLGLAFTLTPAATASTSHGSGRPALDHVSADVPIVPTATTSAGVLTVVPVPSDGRVSTPVYDRPASLTGVSAPVQRPPARPPLVQIVVSALIAAGLFGFGTMRQGEATTGGTLYRPAFHRTGENVPRRIDPSNFKGSAWVDAYGVLKPGTPLKADGTLAGTAAGAANAAVFVVPYGVGIADGNTDAQLDAAPNGDIAARSRGDLVRKDIEAALGRVLTADEIAAYGASGRFVIL